MFAYLILRNKITAVKKRSLSIALQLGPLKTGIKHCLSAGLHI